MTASSTPSTGLLATAIAALISTAALAAPSTTIVISQVYGGGGNSGATYTHDFVGLHNISNAPVNITGWSLQYAASTSSSWSVTNLSPVSIPAGGYYLVQLASGGTTGGALPTPDATGSSTLSASGGKVALVNSTTLLTAGDFTGTAPTGASIVDFIGYGSTANAYEGAGRASGPSNNINSVQRKDQGSTDTDQNSSDCVLAAAAPRNSSSTPYIPAADTTPPGIVSRVPGVAATGVSLTPTISITFSEPVTTGAGGVQLYKEAGATDVLVPTGAISGSGGVTVSFAPTAPLEVGATYYVLVDSTAFYDLAPVPNAFPGISSETAWTFTTVTPPVLDTFVIGGDAATTVTPRVTLDRTSSGGAPTEYIASELSDFSDAVWTALPATAPVFTLSTGNGTKTVYFKLRNAVGETAVLSDTTLRADHTNPGTVLMTQYYEGDTGSNKYIEVTNTTGASIDLDGWKLVRWANEEAQSWKITGAVSTSLNSVIELYGLLAAGETAVFANPAATTPLDSSLAYNSFAGINHNGDDSYGLYQGSVTPQNLRDAIGFTFAGKEGVDTSFVRISAATGFDFVTGSTVLSYPGAWQQVSLATVIAAASTDNAFLGTYPGTAPPAGYSAWATTNAGGQTADLDFDADGIANGTEYFMGTAANAFTANPGLTAGTVTWPRAAGTVIGSFKVEVSTNLTTWEDASLNYGANLAITASQVSFTPPTGAGKIFVRLSVTP